MVTTTKAREKAEEMQQAFTVAERENGEQYHKLRDGSPDWMRDVCFAAHQDGSNGGMLPDDWRYRFISDAIDILAESEEWDDADNDIQADVYTSDLTAWLHSHNGRMAYCDDFASEMGEPGNMFDRLTGGQYMERREVLEQVKAALERITEDA